MARSSSLAISSALLVLAGCGLSTSRTTDRDVWDGYVEAFEFPSGSDHVHIEIAPPPTTGHRTGVVIFGDAPAPPHATDPLVGYPLGMRFDRAQGDPIEGVPYPIVDATVEEDRVRVTIDLASTWVEWCALQTPVSRGDGVFGCNPNWGFTFSEAGCSQPDPVDGHDVPIDCARLELCELLGVCSCNSELCGASPGRVVELDFHVNGDHGDGSVSFGAGHTVHLTR